VVAAIVAAAVLVVPPPAGGQTVSVSAASTPSLRVSEATAGQPPSAVEQSVGTYTFTTTGSGVRRLQARLSASPPAGVTIEVRVDTDPRATNRGWVTLTTTYQDLFTGFPRNTNGTYEITYRITATSAAGVVSARSRTVTLRNAS
jgi:hypothetical protein